MLEVPLAIGVIGVAFMPVLAAIGAAAALATRCTIVVERDEAPPQEPASEASPQEPAAIGTSAQNADG